MCAGVFQLPRLRRNARTQASTCGRLKGLSVSEVQVIVAKLLEMNNLCIPNLKLLLSSQDIKPAIGRPYVRAFSLSGTVPAFTCDCLRFVCAFTPRPKVDLCVSTSSRTMLAFENNVSFSSSACSTPTFCRR